LQSGPKTIDEISGEANIIVNKDKLERMLLALEPKKIFNYDSTSRK